MGELQDNRLVSTFADLRQAGRRALVPFVTAGFPDLETTAALLKDFESRGVRVCEVGVPFSDSIADGPVIQDSYTVALEGGISSEKTNRAIAGYRAAGGKMALVAMVSYSIVFRHGVETYLDRAAEAGFDAVLIPDLPLEEAAAIAPAADQRNLAGVMLVAPTSPPQRRLEIASQSRGFVYYISVRGITGERAKLPEETMLGVADLKKHIETPICVGFGISSPKMVATACKVADGAIVGSAIVKRIAKLAGAGTKKIVADIGGFISDLLAPLS
jgi:tryptophan synthase alpha chain